jgi:hypothetical protein
VHAFGSVVFMWENMDIKDRFTTSSKEQLRSLVLVHELDQITSNGGEDWSVTKEHPRGLKRKRLDSCTENLHIGREDDIIKMVQVKGAKCIITRGPTGAKGRPSRAGMGLGRSAQAGRPDPLRVSVRPPFLALEGSSTLSPWRHCHSQNREPFAPRGHPQDRERGRRSPEEDRPSRRKHPQVEKKEDTVGSVTMINGVMSSTLMGWSSYSSMGCNRSWDVIVTLLEHLSIILCWMCLDA